jgi:hypothetical protein
MTMRAFSVTLARPASAGTWFPGLPHALAAMATWPAFGGPACVAGLLLASLVSFVVWLPMTALALNNGRAVTSDVQAPSLTPNARRALFALWVATAWVAAAVVR